MLLRTASLTVAALAFAGAAYGQQQPVQVAQSLFGGVKRQLTTPTTVETKIDQARWAKPGGTEEEFLKAREACFEEAGPGRGISPAYAQSQGFRVIAKKGPFIACMKTRGFELSMQGGTFTAPPGDKAALID